MRNFDPWYAAFHVQPGDKLYLPPDQREAIRLRVEEDLSYDDAARRVDATPQVVRARVSRGLKTMQRFLGDRALDALADA